MMMVLRADEKHLPDLLVIEQAAFSPSWMEGSLLSELFNEDAYFTVAVEDERVLGFCLLHQVADEAELYQIAVSEDARRRGVANMLMKDAMEYVQKKKLICTYLEVRRSNTPAIKLYKKHGFTVTGYRKKYYSYPVEDAAVMACPNAAVETV